MSTPESCPQENPSTISPVLVISALSCAFLGSNCSLRNMNLSKETKLPFLIVDLYHGKVLYGIVRYTKPIKTNGKSIVCGVRQANNLSALFMIRKKRRIYLWQPLEAAFDQERNWIKTKQPSMVRLQVHGSVFGNCV